MRAAHVFVDTSAPIATIDPNIYGHFAEHLGHCIEGGIWVGPDSDIPNENGIRKDVVAALKRMKPSVVRWPGGCFADDYHWQDGIGPREARPRRINIHWGEVIETNEFGTHEFMEFCRQIGAEPYVCGNMGSGTVREMRDWVEYMNFPGDSAQARARTENGHAEPFNVKYFGVGNENWGCGGSMSPEYYAMEYRRYASFLRPFGGQPLHLIACGPSGDDPNWTHKFFGTLAGCGTGCWPALHLIKGFAAHYYCGTSGNATEYTQEQWYDLLGKALKIEPLIVKHRSIMDGFDPDRRIGLIVDEWGTWHPADAGTNPAFLRQQNTIRDAVVAALTLDVFNRHADKVVMSNIAQFVNVLQAMVLTDGPKMLLTPTYHVYEMYAVHQGATSLKCRFSDDIIDCRIGEAKCTVPRLAGSASRRESVVTVSLVNTSATDELEVDVVLRDTSSVELTDWRVLACGDIHDHNTFDAPETVRPVAGIPVGGRVVLPPASVSVLTYKVW